MFPVSRQEREREKEEEQPGNGVKTELISSFAAWTLTAVFKGKNTGRPTRLQTLSVMELDCKANEEKESGKRNTIFSFPSEDSRSACL